MLLKPNSAKKLCTKHSALYIRFVNMTIANANYIWFGSCVVFIQFTDYICTAVNRCYSKFVPHCVEHELSMLWFWCGTHFLIRYLWKSCSQACYMRRVGQSVGNMSWCTENASNQHNLTHTNSHMLLCESSEQMGKVSKCVCLKKF